MTEATAAPQPQPARSSMSSWWSGGRWQARQSMKSQAAPDHPRKEDEDASTTQQDADESESSTVPAPLTLDDEMSELPTAGTVSITVYRDPSLKSVVVAPFLLGENTDSGEVEIGAVSAGNDDDSSNCLIPASLAPEAPPLLQCGDVLDSVNGWRCKGKSAEEIERLLDQATGFVTLVLKRPKARSSASLRQAIVILPPQQQQQQQQTETSSLEEKEALSSTKLLLGRGLKFSSVAPAAAAAASGADEEIGKPVQRLQVSVDPTDPNSVWTHSSLNASSQSVVVSINDNTCHDMDPDEVLLLLQLKASASRFVSILTYNEDNQQPTTMSSRWRRVRRTAVAVSGGAMLGAGVVIMATPLHPVGHAMAFGGAGLLGTEFEAPRRAMQGLKKRLSVGKQQQQEKSRYDSTGTAPEEEEKAISATKQEPGNPSAAGEASAPNQQPPDQQQQPNDA